MSEPGIGFSPEGRFKKKLTDKTLNGLKCYEIIDGEITGMSLVDVPAHSYKAKIVSEEERTIMGPGLIPDKMIYRVNPITGEEYYIFFTREVITMMHLKYREGNWTEGEYFELAVMYSKGIEIKEISIHFNREVKSIINKIILGGESFRNMAIVLMSPTKSVREMAEILKIHQIEVFMTAAKNRWEIQRGEFPKLTG